MEKLYKELVRNLSIINEQTNNNPDIIIKKTKFFDYNLCVLFSESMSDRMTINNFILKNLNVENRYKKKQDIITYLTESLPIHKTSIVNDFKKLYYNLLSGFTVILIDGFNEAVCFETKAILNSDIAPAQNEKTLKGPKDAFSESYQSNIGLIKKRLKTKNLQIKETIVGNIGQSKLAILSIKGIVDDHLYNYIINKIENIDIDIILDATQIIDIISTNEKNVLPNFMETERPDQVTNMLVDGRIALILENSPYVAVVPIFFEDFFHTPDDLYIRNINTFFNRTIRLLAFFITILTPAIYIAITTYNHETIPSKLLINFSTQRDGVPFSSVIEAIIMTITFEVLKETDIRVPITIGSSLSIVGALVLGDAAVNAGIVSPIMVIVIALTSISGLIISFDDVASGIRWWRFIFLAGASIAGVMGIVVAGLIFIANITSINSFGKPYMIPYAPLIKQDVFNGIFPKFYNKFFKKSKTTTKNTSKQGGI
ncbi:MAG: spore germination protein [Bacilli bacterium]|nr:spore germination protein [Bacilli bacterium]